MSKININFNNTNYSIDESSLTPATAELKSHLSTVMNGTGATINLGGTTYNVDSAKLSAATSDFVNHLGKIAGNGHKVTVNGVEYGIDSTKLTSAISDIEAVLVGTGEERLEGDGAEFYTLAPTALSFRSTAPLNELQDIQINGVTVDPSNYTLEEGSTIVTFPIEYLKTLDVGNYEVTVASDSKTVKGDFTVVEPELNEHGFYYNQPYCANVSAFGGNTVVFLRENGTLDLMLLSSGYVENCPYTISGNGFTTTGSSGTFNGEISNDGTEVYIAELGVAFVLGDESIVSDKDYIYVYKEDFGGYEVTAIDKTKAEYGAIKTGINGLATVKIADEAFAVGDFNFESKMTIAPTIPDSVTIIGQRAFYESALTNISLPSNLISIEESAFFGIYGLTSIKIPASVTVIERIAFGACCFLTSITFEGTTEQWNAISKFKPNSIADWNSEVPATYVQCSDGQVAL